MNCRSWLILLLPLFAALGSRPAAAGGPIASGSIAAGTLAGPGFTESWTFSGTVGQTVVIAAVTTSGAANTVTTLRTPGGASVSSSANDRTEFVLTSTGTWTIQVDDSGLNDAGTYALGFLNVTAGPLTNAGDLDGGPITSSDVVSGTMSGASDFDAYTFSATSGQRVVFHAFATGGAGYNTNLVLYGPAGAQFVTSGSADQLDVQLNATGTWTLVVEDVSVDTPGSYALSFLNVTAGPYSNGSDPDTGTLVSNQIRTGSFQSGVDMDAWTFGGTLGQTVVFAGLTPGGPHNATLALYPPGGGTVVLASANDRVEYTLTATGTWTLVMYDSGLNDAGAYTLGFLNVNGGPLTDGADLNGGPITSSDVVSGTMSGAGDFDAYTFSATSGQRVVFNAFATGGAGYNTNLVLYGPAGGQFVTSGSADQLDVQLNATGTWTVVVEDLGVDTPGSYAFSFLNVTVGPYSNGGDPDTGTLVSNQIRTGSFQSGVDMDAWTFGGTLGQTVVFAGLTPGGPHNATLALYPPGGGPAVLTSANDRVEHTLTATGTWTLVLYDSGLNDAGAYTLGFLNVNGGPLTDGADLNGGPITSSDVVSGTMSGAGDFDAYTFSATSGQRVVFNAFATGGAGYNTNLVLYGPAGGQFVTSGSADQLDVQLNATGTWTVVVEDLGVDTPGSYALSFLNVTAGPYSNGGDPDTGTLVSNQIRTGSFQSSVDMDAWTFGGTLGQTVVFAGLTPGGPHNATLALYPPGGGPAVLTSANDRVEYTLTATGTWTLVMYDSGLNDAGAYTLGFLNVNGGPLTDGADLNGGPITSSDVVSGTMSGAGDFDAYTFSATSGQRVVFNAFATGGAGYNTNLVLYGPAGGQFVTSGSADQLDVQLNATGTWTVVVEDLGVDTPGSYAFSLLNVTAGPYSNGGDPDTGTLVSNQIRTGSFQSGVDMDAWTFGGTLGQTVVFAGLTPGGPHNATLALYPPGGGPAVLTSANDRVEHTLTATGTWTLVLYDSGLNDAGAYTLGFLNVNGGPLTDGADLDGGLLKSNDNRFGTSSGAGDFDAWTFLATNSDRILISAFNTGGAGYNTNLVLYGPAGAQFSSSGSADLLDVQLNATGMWTVVVEDLGVDTPGSYSLCLLNLGGGPLNTNGDPGVVETGVPVDVAIAQPADLDGFVFYGASGETATINAVTLSGAMNTQIALYPPGGGAAMSSTSNDNLVMALTTSGYYRVVITDSGLNDIGTYRLTLTGSGAQSGLPVAGSELPDGVRVALASPSPSPFQSTTRLLFRLRHDVPVTLRIFDARGALVRTLIDATLPPGPHEAVWDGTDDRGRAAGSGVYHLQLRADGDDIRRKVVRVR